MIIVVCVLPSIRKRSRDYVMCCVFYFYQIYRYYNRTAAIVNKLYFVNIVANIYCSKGRCCAVCSWRQVDKRCMTYSIDSISHLKNLKNTTFRWPIDNITLYIIHNVCVYVCKKKDSVIFPFFL